MKTKLLMSFLSFFIIFAVVLALSQNAHSQGNVAVLFDGTVLAGNPNFFGKSASDVADLNKMKSAQSIFPGVEVRFNQNGRVTLGVSYQRWQMEDGPRHVTLTKPDGTFAASWDKSSEASANVVLATLYVNILTHGKVRPFVGFGGGYAPFDATSTIDNYTINPELATPGFQVPTTIVKTGKISRTVIKGTAGLNFFPAKHFVLSFGGGYISGPAVSLGAGFTF